MTNADYNLADILRSVRELDLPSVLDDEVGGADPVEPAPREDVPFGRGDEPTEYDDQVVRIDPVESQPGEDVPFEPADPGEGEVSIQPVEEGPEHVFIEPEPGLDPDPVVSIQPVENEDEGLDEIYAHADDLPVT